MKRGLVFVLALAALPARASDTLQWDGFALVRGTSSVASGPLRNDQTLSAQLQLGLDWSPSPRLLAHVHLLGRTDSGGARRGKAGIPEAYLDTYFRPRDTRVRLRAGAFFLPTSRENVDALWESPYTISPSALNGWFGEELRPIGVDAAVARHGFSAGATIFRGNDTFGALPAARGWQMHDRWTLLGEWVPVDDEYFTSVSAENDHHLGFSARAGWSGGGVRLQATHIDNRSDGRDYGELFDWNTRFDLVSAEYARGDWTIAAEYGRGPTYLVVFDQEFTTDIDAGYVLVSKNLGFARASVRAETFSGMRRDHAVTAAVLFNAPMRFQPGVEISHAAGKTRVIGEVRWRLR